MPESDENSLWTTSATWNHKCGSFKRNSSVSPFSIFLFLFLCGLTCSFYLSLIFPLHNFLIVYLWDILFVYSLGSFPHFKGNTLYITRMMKITHFTKSSQHIENWKLSWCIQMYAFASVAGYAMILARHVAIIRASTN